MTADEIRHFLLDTPRTGKMAIVRKDGRPRVAPIWFDLDGEKLIFTTWHKSLKGQHLQNGSYVSMAVDDERPPYAYVIYEGRAEIGTPTPEELVYWASRLAGRYMGADKAAAYGKRNGVPGELLIRVTPTTIIGKAGISD
jgi:PPOX class probable F420-dependent enzyme